MFFLDENLDQTTTINGFSSQNQIKRAITLVVILLVLEIDISTLKMKFNH